MAHPKLRFPHLRQLAQAVRRPVAVFDLETSAPYPTLPAGITDWAVLVVSPSSENGQMYRSRVDPEAPLNPEMSALTGIVAETLQGARAWPEAGAQFFQCLQGALLAGYFSRGYDVPVLQQQARRYRLAEPVFAHHLDLGKYVEQVYGHRLTLVTAARRRGIEYLGPLHQATEDTVLTAWLLERIVQIDGIESILRFLRPGALAQRAS